jgi:hypothetical protein
MHVNGVCASYREGGASPSSLPVNPACGYTAGAEPGNGLVTFESRCRCVLDIRYCSATTAHRHTTTRVGKSIPRLSEVNQKMLATQVIGACA